MRDCWWKTSGVLGARLVGKQVLREASQHSREREGQARAMKDSREQRRVGAAAGASANCPIEGRWSLASQWMDRCSSILRQGGSRVDDLIKFQITACHPKPGRNGGRKTCSFSPDAGGVQSTLSVPSFIHLTSQSLQTSSKDLKARWKQRQNHGKRDCTAPEPFPSVGREVGS